MTSGPSNNNSQLGQNIASYATGTTNSLTLGTSGMGVVTPTSIPGALGSVFGDLFGNWSNTFGGPQTPSNPPSVTDPNPCPAFSLSDPMPSISCTFRTDVVWFVEITLIAIVIVVGIFLMIEKTSVAQTTSDVVKSGVKGYVAGASGVEGASMVAGSAHVQKRLAQGTVHYENAKKEIEENKKKEDIKKLSPPKENDTINKIASRVVEKRKQALARKLTKGIEDLKRDSPKGEVNEFNVIDTHFKEFKEKASVEEMNRMVDLYHNASVARVRYKNYYKMVEDLDKQLLKIGNDTTKTAEFAALYNKRQSVGNELEKYENDYKAAIVDIKLLANTFPKEE